MKMSLSNNRTSFQLFVLSVVVCYSTSLIPNVIASSTLKNRKNVPFTRSKIENHSGLDATLGFDSGTDVYSHEEMLSSEISSGSSSVTSSSIPQRRALKGKKGKRGGKGKSKGGKGKGKHYDYKYMMDYDHHNHHHYHPHNSGYHYGKGKGKGKKGSYHYHGHHGGHYYPSYGGKGKGYNHHYNYYDYYDSNHNWHHHGNHYGWYHNGYGYGNGHYVDHYYYGNGHYHYGGYPYYGGGYKEGCSKGRPEGKGSSSSSYKHRSLHNFYYYGYPYYQKHPPSYYYYNNYDGNDYGYPYYQKHPPSYYYYNNYYGNDDGYYYYESTKCKEEPQETAPPQPVTSSPTATLAFYPIPEGGISCYPVDSEVEVVKTVLYYEYILEVEDGYDADKAVKNIESSLLMMVQENALDLLDCDSHKGGVVVGVGGMSTGDGKEDASDAVAAGGIVGGGMGGEDGADGVAGGGMGAGKEGSVDGKGAAVVVGIDSKPADEVACK